MRGQRLICRTFGQPEKVLQLEDISISPPQQDELVVRMIARPINPSDLIPIRGSYSHRIDLPYIPGYEGVGIVEQVGSSDYKHLIGQRVLPLLGQGTWQQYVTSPARFAIPIPSSIDNITAAQLYINPLTAFVTSREVLQLKMGDVLLVNACNSAIGKLYIQLSKIYGFRVIAVTRNNHHTEELLRLGAEVVIDTTTMSLFETVMALTNGCGADAAIDSIGGRQGNNLAFAVRPNGQFLTIGLLSGEQVNWSAIVNKAYVEANIFHLRHWNHQVTVEQWQSTFKQLIQLIEAGKLELMKPSAQFSLQQYKTAISAVEDQIGKVFLV
ncbi:zinc-dependent alcohol dehydrogenase family protein [Kurthia sibirica]|uniref:Alcohol dehydrogenase n=1 Tax=Kurthia sibirica TaxID=202750 RepID=A0A2U3AKQ6_9BACL|nr:zinc-dependent alcohol dehydrogenase family protein [Kurthia sibirica]PWI25109.1 alcohol dehydrogenase [Kurthia sibirica]GEK34029.1 alcohol dehydrogenase [Kurthia sibirica]